MAITEADINEMLAFLVTHPEYLDRFRALSVTPELQTVPLRMDRLEVAMTRLETTVEVLVQSTQRLAEESANARTDINRLNATAEQLTQLTARQNDRLDRVEAAIEKLVTATSELTAESVRTGRTLNRLHGTVSNMKGSALETKYSNNVENWFGDYLLAPVKVAVRRLPGLKDAEANGLVSPQEVIALRALDLVVRGQDEETGGDVYIAAEISNVIDADDVVRARQRADLLKRLGIDAWAFVGGHEITSDALIYAASVGVLVDLHPEK